MRNSAGRLLSLLTLLQARTELTSSELADRLQVTTRTVRNDVQRLRDLGYPIHGTPGVAGGYRLGAGARLPPLLLDDDEAVATAIGLRTAASGSVGGLQEPTLRAVSKLDGVLPSRLRRRVSSLSEAISTVPAAGPVVDPAVLATVAGAIRDRELLRFEYRRHDQTSAHREAEPHRLVYAGRRWYLVGWDMGQQDWRTYRVDRMRVKVPNGRRFTTRPPPAGGFERHVTEGLSVQSWPVVGRFLLHAPLEQVENRSHLTEGALTAVDDHHCLLTVGADSEAFLLVIVGIYDVDFTVLDPPSLRKRAASLARRYLQATEAPDVTAEGDSC
jgi:predicted DNA-binding transcriptional regulator YafY